MLGLPECAVGLLPGAGGTQRMPRLVGIALGLEVLLLGRTLAGAEALEAGLVDAVVDEGEEIRVAEDWLLSPSAHAVQPWDRDGAAPLAHTAYADAVAAHRTREMARMFGHEPAPLAIVDCVKFGLMQPLDGAIRAEMSVFARLIQRPEPRNMIRTMFLGKQAYDKPSREGTLSPAVTAASEQVTAILHSTAAAHPDLHLSGFMPDIAAVLGELRPRFAAIEAKLSPLEALQLDHAVTLSGAIPAYLGGVSGLMA